MLLGHEVERPTETRSIARRDKSSGVVVPGLPGPPMDLGTERSTLTSPSLDCVWPLRPPLAVAVAVYKGLMISMVLTPVAEMKGRREPARV
jgi:hypothetical protein